MRRIKNKRIYREITGIIEIKELKNESKELMESVGGSTNSTRNTCRCPKQTVCFVSIAD